MRRIEDAITWIEDRILGDLDADEATRARLRGEQLTRFMRLGPVLMATCFFHALNLTVILNREGFVFYPTLWLGLIMAMSALFLVRNRAFLKRGRLERASVRTVRRFSVSTTLYGFIWGALPLVSHSSISPFDQSMVYVILAGIIGGGCVVLGFVPAAMYGWVTAGLSMWLVSLTTLSVASAIGLAMSTTLFAGVLLHASRAYGHAFASAVIREMKTREQATTIQTLLDEFENSGRDWLWETDKKGKLVRGMSELIQLTGLDKADLISLLRGEQPSAVTASDGVSDIRQHAQRRLAFKGLAVELDRADGGFSSFTVSGKPVYDKDGIFLGFRGVVCDTTQARRQERNVKWLAHHDPLTGLSNRAAMNAHFADILADGKSKTEFVMLYLDLNGFKSINDMMGHAAGDLILQVFARRLRDVVPPNAMVARMGGDEFVVGYQRKTPDAPLAETLAAAIAEAACEPIVVAGNNMQVGCSIGIALAPIHAQSSEDLINAADLALYAAKADPQVFWCVFDPSMAKSKKREREMEEALRRAITDDAIEVHFQPFFDLRSGRLMGFEALARWTDPVFGSVSPGVFIPLAERNGSIVDLGSAVLHRACKLAAEWPSNLKIAVNLSVAQFRDHRASKAVRSALEASKLDPKRLEVEITEQVFAHDVQMVYEEMNTIRSLGVSISLDDFGTGYSSLHYLRNFPFDKLKIDRGFVIEAGRDKRSHEVLSVMRDLADRLDLSTTVEGIETPEQLEMVQQMGFTYSQGFLQGRPVPVTQIAAIVLKDARHDLDMTQSGPASSLPIAEPVAFDTASAKNDQMADKGRRG